MKFLDKINRQYFWILTILLVLASVIGYFALRIVLTNKMKEDIFEKEYAIIKEIENGGDLPNIFPIIEVKKIVKSESVLKSYKEMYLYDEAENEEEPFWEYTNTVEINNQFYLIKLRHSLLENNKMIFAIALPILLLLMMTFTVSFLLTRKLNETIWKDFKENLNIIENFSLTSSKVIALKQTDIEEFNRLNETIKELAGKLKNDYQILKQFTENSSHEIQTPLTIILLNLEELLQQDLSEQSFKQVVTTINAVKRLSQLNQSLILLTKIENNQFHTTEQLIFNNIVKAKLKEFALLLEKQNVKIEYSFNDNFIVLMNEKLADILIGNLLSNAIKHNFRNGKIEIITDKNKFEICNTGDKNRLTNENIFNRFVKENSQSYGLGLAIVKQICDVHNLQISYSRNDLHCFIIKENTA